MLKRIDAFNWLILALTFWLSCSSPATASAAQDSPPLDCQKLQEPASTAPGAAPLVVTVDSASSWRPLGGDVKFTIQGQSFSAATAEVATCFRWKNFADSRNVWRQSPPPKPVVDPNQTGASYLASVPPVLGDAPWDMLRRLVGLTKSQGLARSGASTALGMVPLADFRVLARPSGNAQWTFVDVMPQPIGITSESFAVTVTATLVLLAWFVLYRFGQLRGVPGAGDPILQVISTKHGYASLSQLQILLWAFVIGGSAIYVMGLSGNLIPISQGTLVLLGISGVATLGAQIQTNTGTQATSMPAQAPQIVSGLITSEVSDTEVRLSWATPVGGNVDTYTVCYQPTAMPGGAWTTFTTAVEGLSQRVTGLSPNTAYAFQVFGMNAAGPGPAAQVNETTAAAPAGPGPVQGFGPLKVANRTLQLAWDPLPGPGLYRVEYRAHDGDDDWTVSASGGTSTTLTGLDAYTRYDVRISAAAPPAAGAPVFGPSTTLMISTIGPRKPLWSDLVIQSDGQDEIDVTRVQMLFFTVIVALFVGLRVLTSSMIPQIPEGFLVLMGISNGVYLTSKFIPH